MPKNSDVPPVILSFVVNTPAKDTYVITLPASEITLPVAPVAEPVMTSPTVNVPVSFVMVRVGATAGVAIAVDSYTATRQSYKGAHQLYKGAQSTKNSTITNI